MKSNASIKERAQANLVEYALWKTRQLFRATGELVSETWPNIQILVIVLLSLLTWPVSIFVISLYSRDYDRQKCDELDRKKGSWRGKNE